MRSSFSIDLIGNEISEFVLSLGFLQKRVRYKNVYLLSINVFVKQWCNPKVARIYINLKAILQGIIVIGGKIRYVNSA